METSSPEKKRTGVTPRAIIVALILIPINSYWIFMTRDHPLSGPPDNDLAFLQLDLQPCRSDPLNGLLRRFAPQVGVQPERAYHDLRDAQHRRGAGGARLDTDTRLVDALRGQLPDRRTTSGGTLFADRLPDWLMVKDPVAIKHFYARRAELPERRRTSRRGSCRCCGGRRSSSCSAGCSCA